MFKKLTFILLGLILFFSCKKETPQPLTEESCETNFMETENPHVMFNTGFLGKWALSGGSLGINNPDPSLNKVKWEFKSNDSLYVNVDTSYHHYPNARFLQHGTYYYEYNSLTNFLYIDGWTFDVSFTDSNMWLHRRYTTVCFDFANFVPIP